ncbi:polysaccharide deacetylase family protein [Pyxidicoccus sp. 3LG]
MKKHLLLLLLLSCSACTRPAPSAPAETAQRGDAILTDAQSGNYMQASPLPYRTISFTFDDGPDSPPPADGGTVSGDGGTSLMIAEYLSQQGIRATFFINGIRIDGADAGGVSNPAYLGRIVELGHRVANHTFDHPDLPSVGAAAQRLTVKRNQDILDPHITDGMFLFRAPGDNWGQIPRDGEHACDGSSSVANNLRSEPALSKLTGPFCFDWDAHDWVCTNEHRTPEQCADYYRDMGLVAGSGLGPERGIVQMHDLSPTAGYANTDWAYRFVVSLVTKLKAVSGTPYVFVPLDAIPGVRGMYSFPAPTNWTTGYLSDADNWHDDIGYYGTVRLGDIDGDGDADVCGRGGAGLRCARSNADGSMAAEALWLGVVSDSLGYKPPEYSTTFQLAYIDNDNKADACIRAAAGYLCFRSLHPASDSFQTSAWLASSFSDANGWGASEALHGSIRVGDIDGDGDGDICGRNAAGEIVCSLFNGAGFDAAVSWSSAFTAALWTQAKHSTTFQLAKVNNDSKADLCVRGTDGVWCALSSGSGFGVPTLWSQMSFDDAQGWGTAASRYKSIKLGDVDGDGLADVCGRHSTGLACGFSTGSGFRNYRYVFNTNFGDANGWSGEEYGATLAMGDVNGDGRADLCARAVAGLTCTLAPTLLATYDATLHAGLCSTAQPSCDSGMFYEGRGTVRPEANPPNTLQGTCADGSDGTDLSAIERVRVLTLDKTNFAPGKTVRVEVSARASGAGAVVELFSAANAASPTWVSLGTTTLSSAGFAWVTRTYSLPSGAQQAVRAVLRPSGLSGACPGGVTTDVDDLAFTVQ